MDDIDRKILKMLESNARIPLKQVAQQVFLSPPAVSARIESLEKQGVIKGYRTVVSPKKLGYTISAFVSVILTPEKKDAFGEFVQDHKNVTECYHVTGAYSMMLRAAFRDMDELDAFIAQAQRFGKTQTQLVFSTVVPQRNIE